MAWFRRKKKKSLADELSGSLQQRMKDYDSAVEAGKSTSRFFGEREREKERYVKPTAQRTEEYLEDPTHKPTAQRTSEFLERQNRMRDQPVKKEDIVKAEPVDRREHESRKFQKGQKFGEAYAGLMSKADKILHPVREGIDKLIPDTKYTKAWKGGKREAGALMGSAAQYVGAEVNSELLKGFGSGYRKENLQEMEAQDLIPKGTENIIEKSIRAVPLTTTGIAIGAGAGIATRSPKAGMAAGALFIGLAEAGGAYSEAIESGASEEEAEVAARITGGINAVLESLPMGRYINKLTGGKKKIVAETVRKGILQKVRNSGLMKFAQERGKDYIAEASTEWAQEIVGNLAANYAYGAGKSPFEGAGEAFSVGGIIGMFFGGITGGIGSQMPQEQIRREEPLALPLGQEPPSQAPAEDQQKNKEDVSNILGGLTEGDTEKVKVVLDEMTEQGKSQLKDILSQAVKTGNKEVQGHIDLLSKIVKGEEIEEEVEDLKEYDTEENQYIEKETDEEADVLRKEAKAEPAKELKALDESKKELLAKKAEVKKAEAKKVAQKEIDEVDEKRNGIKDRLDEEDKKFVLSTRKRTVEAEKFMEEMEKSKAKERGELAGLSPHKFKVGDKVSMSAKTGLGAGVGIISSVSKGGHHYTVKRGASKFSVTTKDLTRHKEEKIKRRGIKKKEVSDKYFLRDADKFIETKGKPVSIEGFEKYDFFVHRILEGDGWGVSEGSTGMIIGIPTSTQRQAIDNAKDVVNAKKDEIDKAIKSQIKKHGTSPRYKQVTKKDERTRDIRGARKPKAHADIVRKGEAPSGKIRKGITKPSRKVARGERGVSDAGAGERLGEVSSFKLSEKQAEAIKRGDEIPDLLGEEGSEKRPSPRPVLIGEEDLKEYEKGQTVEYHNKNYELLDAIKGRRLLYETEFKLRGEDGKIKTVKGFHKEAELSVRKDGITKDKVAPFAQREVLMSRLKEDEELISALKDKSNAKDSVELLFNEKFAEKLDEFFDTDKVFWDDLNENKMAREAVRDDIFNELYQKSKKETGEKKAKEYVTAGGRAKQGKTGRGLLDEYFTPAKAVQKTIGLAKQYSEIPIETVLEPSVGTGNFLKGLEDKEITAYEINEETAGITQERFPSATVLNKPFEDMFIDDRGNKKPISRKFDLVVGNPPFGIHRGEYKGLGEEPKIGRYEEYFIKRALDVTKEDGIVAMVVASSFMRSKSTYGKTEICKLGYLAEAYRLPSGIFETTDVGTDILIFKRSGESSPAAIGTRRILITGNHFFDRNKDKVLGKEVSVTGRFGTETKRVEGTLEELDVIKVEESMEVEEAQEVEQEKKEMGTKSRVKAKPKVKKDVNKKVVIVSDKKDATRTIGKKEAEEYLPLWKKQKADGTVELTDDEIKKFDDRLVMYRGEYMIDTNYYQGNIYEKLAQLEKEKSNLPDGFYEKQKAGLENAMPEKKTLENITLTPNSDFVKKQKFKHGRGIISLGTLFENYMSELPSQAFENSSPYEIQGYMSGTVVNVGDKLRNIAQRKSRRLVGNKLFKRFLVEELDSKKRAVIERKYNKQWNSFAKANYNEIPLTSKINKTFKGKPLKMKPIQVEGAAFLANKGVGLLGYDVGVGKTMTAIVAINEMLQRGWAKKPLVIVPNSVYLKWIDEIQEIIPNVKINSLANLGAKFKGDLGTLKIEDKSISIISYEGMNKLGFKKATFTELTKGLEDVMTGVDKVSARQKELEKAKGRELAGKARRGTVAIRNFEDLGFDHLTVDEVHNFKNIFAGAKMKDRTGNEFRNVRGSTSMRGIKMYLMTQYILNRNNGRNVFGLSATPFSNNPLEIYSIISLFGKSQLEKMGMNNVNEFMTMFMELTPRLIVKAQQELKEEDVIERFYNLQELQQLVTGYIDFRTGLEADILRPDKQKKKVFVKPTVRQIEHRDKAQKLFDDKEAGGAIAAITELRNIALSPYLSRYNAETPTAKEFVENSPKINYSMKAIAQTRKDKPEVGQVLYMPLGMEYLNHVKEYAVEELGFTENEVAIIRGGMNINTKSGVQNDFNKGDVKLLIGTETIKEGIDLQENSTDLYHLHLPWNPTDLQQIEGRIWRQGNQWKNIRIHYPLVENIIDSFLFQKLETKEKRIKNLWSYKGDQIEVGDLNFEEAKMDLITDPLMKVRAKKLVEKGKIVMEIDSKKAERAFLDKRLSAINDVKSDITRADDNVAYWKKEKDAEMAKSAAEALKTAKKKLKAEEQKLVKTGVTVEQAEEKREKFTKEIDEAELKEEALDKKYEELEKVAEKERVAAVSTVTDYDTLIADIKKENETFFVEEKGRAQRMTKEEQEEELELNVIEKDQAYRIADMQIDKKTAVKILRKYFSEDEVSIKHANRIEANDGLLAWGVALKDLVVFARSPKEETPYHESVHLFIQNFLPTDEFRGLMDAVKAQYKDKISDVEAEEILADRFIYYVKEQQRKPLPGKIEKIFAKIKEFLLRMVGKEDKINKFYAELVAKKRPSKTLEVLGKEYGMWDRPEYGKAKYQLVSEKGQLKTATLYRKIYEEYYSEKSPAFAEIVEKEDVEFYARTAKKAFTLGKQFSRERTKAIWKGKADAKEAYRKDLKNHIVKNIPVKYRSKLIRDVANANTEKKFINAISKVDYMVQTGFGKETPVAIKEMRQKVSAKMAVRGIDSSTKGIIVQKLLKDTPRPAKMHHMTFEELALMEEIVDSIKKDKFGRFKLISDKKIVKLGDIIPENLKGKTIISLGDLEESFNFKDTIAFDSFNLARGGRFVMSKNEVTKKVYDKTVIADREYEAGFDTFKESLREMYQKASGKRFGFMRDKKLDNKLIDYHENKIKASELSVAEKALADKMINFYADSIEIMKPHRLRKGYFTHTRQSFLELVKDVGLKDALGEVIDQQLLEDYQKELPQEIAGQLENLFANQKFNPYALKRRGFKMSRDYRKALQLYARVYYFKKHLDPIFSQSNALKNFLPVHLQRYFTRWTQSVKGRPDVLPNYVKKPLNFLVAFEYMKLLGLNYASGIFNATIGFVDNFASIPVDKHAVGHARYTTPQGYNLIKKYRITNKNITYEATQVMDVVPETVNKILFFMMGMGEHYLRGVAFLSYLTTEEFNSGEVSDARWNEIRHHIGEAQPIYGRGDSPVWARHGIGKTFFMFMSWLPTRIENWRNWIVGASTALKNEKGLMNKTVKNEDLRKIIKWFAAFIVVSMAYGALLDDDDYDRMDVQKKDYLDMISPKYWINLMSPDSKPVWKDIVNIGLILKYMAKQEEYEKSGYDYERHESKAMVYAKRTFLPIFIKRIMRND